MYVSLVYMLIYTLRMSDPYLTVLQPWYRGSSRDPSVPKIHRAADPQAALPAPGEGNRPGLQDRSPLPERRHRGPAGQLRSSKID